MPTVRLPTMEAAERSSASRRFGRCWRQSTRYDAEVQLTLGRPLVHATVSKEGPMAKQGCLDLWEQRLGALWRRLPEEARRAVIEQYARLIARAAQAPKSKRGAAQR